MNPEAAPPHATTGPVHIVGAGLIGASVGLGLRQLGLEVTLEDPSPAAAAVAEQVGAGRRRQPKDPEPQVVVVAVPPDVTANVVAQALARFSAATVTDAASVKAVILEELTQLGADLSRYVGSHPMAGRERSGPAAGSGDLFVGRPWVITANPATAPERVLQIRHLATDLGANPTFLDAATHDTSVALVSHLPQILSSLTAARLVQAEAGALDLAGQGLRDVTRIAGSDPELWSAILVGNGPAVAAVLREVQADLAHAIGALEMGTAPATLGQSLKTLADLVAQGRRGAERIPGKHGGARRQFDRVTVMVPDRPGALGELFQEMGRLGVNLEDLKLEHGMGQLVGLAEVWVPLGQGAPLAADLEEQGWRILK